MSKTGNKVFLALPLYGDCDPYWVHSMMELIRSRSEKHPLIKSPLVDFEIQTNVGDSLIPRSRNALAAEFLKSDCDQLIFIDCDIIFSPEHFYRLASHQEGVVGGFYPKKQQGATEMVCNVPDPVDPPRPDGLQRMAYIGTGFMKIRRFVFEAMRERYRDEIEFRPDQSAEGTKHWDFFQTGVYTYPNGAKRYLSEDWFFCQRAMNFGVTIWGDTQIVLGHRGRIIFPLDSQKNDPVFTPPKAAETPPPASAAALLLPVGDADKAVSAAVVPRGTIALPADFIVPSEAADDAKAIMAGCYDVPGMREPPKSVLDAGAHVGLFSYWAHYRWPNSMVKAFEPCEDNWKSLRRNFCGVPYVFLNRSALSDHNNKLSMFLGRNSLCHTVKGELSAPVPSGTKNRFEVLCTDARTIGKFDFVKVDTEGSELPILSALDLSETKAVVCEVHSEEDRPKVRDILMRQGFELVSSEPTLNGCHLVKWARKEALVS